MILEAFVLASSLSLDAFLACFACGSGKIHLPLSSALAIDLTCSGVLGIFWLAGALVRPWIPPAAASVVCFALLFLMGLVKLLDGEARAFLRRHGDFSRNIAFSALHFRFVLSVYADPEKADADASKSISLREAVSLSAALSLDGAAAGFGAALGSVSGRAVIAASLLTGACAIFGGFALGNRIAGRLRFPVSRLSGAILIGLAFLKLL